MLIGVDPFIYEIVNLLLCGLATHVVVIFGRYLITEYQERRFTFKGIVSMRTMLRHQMAIAILITCAGETTVRGWTWYARFAARMGIDTLWMAESPWRFYPLVTATVEAAGLLCLIRVFAPDDWGHRWWLICAGMVIAFTIAISSIG